MAIRPRALAALYFAYFAFVGAFSPYLALWFAARGLSIPEIGVLMSLPQALRIVAPPFWGWLADRSGRHVHLLRATAVAVVAGVAALALADGYVALVAAMVALFFASSAQSPLTEALACELVRGDPGAYGRIRLWGSVGFIAAVSSTGLLLDGFGVAALPAWMGVLAGALALVAWQVPSIRVERPVRSRSGEGGARLSDPAVMAFFASAFLMIFAHAALYAFYSLHLERLGYSRAAIGLLWAAGVAVEIALFRWQRPLFDRFDATRLLQASFAVAAVRFLLIAGAESSLAWLVLAQALHAVTFGVHHSASVALLHRWFAARGQAAAHAWYVTIGYGCGGTAGGLVASWLWQAFDARAMWLGAAAAASLGGVAAARCARRAMRDNAPEPSGARR